MPDTAADKVGSAGVGVGDSLDDRQMAGLPGLGQRLEHGMQTDVIIEPNELFPRQPQ